MSARNIDFAYSSSISTISIKYWNFSAHVVFFSLYHKYIFIFLQASYTCRYAILWEAFLDPSDFYFLFADFVDFYTHWTIYAHFSSHFSQQLLMAEIWYFVTIFILVRNIVGSAFGPVRCLIPVCRLSWFLYTLNIYANVFVTFFSATIDGRNLIFGHKLHIGTPYRGKRFWTHQIPTSCLPAWLVFIHIEH
jgi:hypothetical protein